MKKDSDKLDSDLSTKYCGQQAARRIILKAVAYHWGDSNPNKPLVFSFHGPPGELVSLNIWCVESSGKQFFKSIASL